MARQLLWWEHCLDWVRMRLKKRDSLMVGQYAREHGLQDMGVTFEFEVG